MHWTVRDAAAIGVLCVVLVALVWPVALAPGTASFDYNADGMFHVWLVTWVARALTSTPLQLYDANIYYPEAQSLRFADSALVPGAVAVPAWLLTGSPRIAHNVSWLLGFLFTGLSMFWLVRYLTRDRLAALLAAVLFAFNPHVATRYPHIMAVYMPGLAIACLAVERMRADEAWRWPVLLGIAVLVSGATSGYQGVMAAVLVGVLWLVRMPEAVVAPWRFAARAAVAIAVAGLAGWTVLSPWLSGGVAQPRQTYATLWSYALTTSHVHWFWSGSLYRGGHGEAFFPGVAALALAGTGLWTEWASGGRRRLTVRGYLVVAAVGMVLSLDLPLFHLLRTVFPPMAGMRAVGRFGVLYITGLAVLAGFGVQAVRRRLRGRRGRFVAVALIALVSVEAYAPPRVSAEFEAPAIYNRLARMRDDTVVAEFPFFRNRPERHARYVLASTRHWRRMVNGYGSTRPAGQARRTSILARFPDRRSLRVLDEVGVTAVMVHSHLLDDETSAAMLAALQGNRRFKLLRATDDGHQLFRYRPRRSR